MSPEGDAISPLPSHEALEPLTAAPERSISEEMFLRCLRQKKRLSHRKSVSVLGDVHGSCWHPHMAGSTKTPVPVEGPCHLPTAPQQAGWLLDSGMGHLIH